MRRSMVAMAVSTALVLASGIAFAQKGQGPKGPKPAHAAQGPKAKAPATGTKAHGPKASTTSKSHGKPTATTSVAATKTKTTGADRGRTTSPTDATLSPVQQKLQTNTKLASKLEGRLPGTTNIIDAAEGFRNLGQFVAAVNVSNNLGISFADLKTRMVDDGMSLGQAIKAERNNADVTTEVRRAESDARIVIADADQAMKKEQAKKKKDMKAPKAKKRDGR